MELCSDGHDEVCYDGNKYCPVCVMMGDKADVEMERDRLINEVAELKDRVAKLEAERED